MSKVPAWKRLGLQVKTDIEDDPLRTTTHLEHDTITNKIAKKLAKKRKLEDAKREEQEKKPPKRVKLPKSKRKPPPEKDQLLYLRQYAEDLDNWKFSKQKQNWILKNIIDIPAQYEDALVVYVEGLQGGARDRLVPELKKVVDAWNEVTQKIEDKVNAELYGTSEENHNAAEEEKKDEPEEKDSGPLREYAIRCKRLLKAILDEEFELKGVEQEESKQEESKAKKEENEESNDRKNGQYSSEDAGNDEGEDNLIIEDIEVEDYQYSTQEEDKLEEEPKTEKKSTKDSNSKKDTLDNEAEEKHEKNGKSEMKEKSNKKNKKEKKKEKKKMKKVNW